MLRMRSLISFLELKDQMVKTLNIDETHELIYHEGVEVLQLYPRLFIHG